MLPICITAGTLSKVPVTCPQVSPMKFLIKPLDPLNGYLPEGFLVSPALVHTEKGTLYAPVTNVGQSDVWLAPHKVFRTVQAVDGRDILADNSQHVELSLDKPPWQCTAYISTQVAELDSSAPLDIESLTFPGLNPNETAQARSLLNRYQSLFSKGEGDLGCTNLIKNEISLLDKASVHQPYRRIPLSQYEAVKAHIKQLLHSQVIRESCSPHSSLIVLVMSKVGGLCICVDNRQFVGALGRYQ